MSCASPSTTCSLRSTRYVERITSLCSNADTSSPRVKKRHYQNPLISDSPPPKAISDKNTSPSEIDAFLALKFLYNNRHLCELVSLTSLPVAQFLRAFTPWTRQIVNEAHGPLKTISDLPYESVNRDKCGPKISFQISAARYNQSENRRLMPGKSGPVQTIITVNSLNELLPPPCLHPNLIRTSMLPIRSIKKRRHGIAEIRVNADESNLLLSLYAIKGYKQLLNLPTEKCPSFTVHLTIHKLSAFLALDPQSSEFNDLFPCDYIRHVVIKRPHGDPSFLSPVEASALQSKLLCFPFLETLDCSKYSLDFKVDFFPPSTLKKIKIGHIRGKLIFSSSSSCTHLKTGSIGSGDESTTTAGTVLVPESLRFLKVGRVSGTIRFPRFSQCAVIEAQTICPYALILIQKSASKFERRFPPDLLNLSINGVLCYESATFSAVSLCKSLKGSLPILKLTYDCNSGTLGSLKSFDDFYLLESGEKRPTEEVILRRVFEKFAHPVFPASVKRLEMLNTNLDCTLVFPVTTCCTFLKLLDIPRETTVIVPPSVEVLEAGNIYGTLLFAPNSRCRIIKLGDILPGAVVHFPHSLTNLTAGNISSAPLFLYKVVHTRIIDTEDEESTISELVSCCTQIKAGDISLGCSLDIPISVEKCKLGSIWGSVFFSRFSKCKYLKVKGIHGTLDVPDSVVKFRAKNLFDSSMTNFSPSGQCNSIKVGDVQNTALLTVSPQVRNLKIDVLAGRLSFHQNSTCKRITVSSMENGAELFVPPSVKYLEVKQSVCKVVFCGDSRCKHVSLGNLLDSTPYTIFPDSILYASFKRVDRTLAFSPTSLCYKIATQHIGAKGSLNVPPMVKRIATGNIMGKLRFLPLSTCKRMDLGDIVGTVIKVPQSAEYVSVGRITGILSFPPKSQHKRITFISGPPFASGVVENAPE